MSPQRARSHTGVGLLLLTLVCLFSSSILAQTRGDYHDYESQDDTDQLPPLPDHSTTCPPRPEPGDLVCNDYLHTDEDVYGWFTCMELVHKASISFDGLLALNPTLDEDCSNIQPLSWYCVEAFREPLRAWDGKCGLPHNNAICAGTGLGCCNARTWTCGHSDEDCAPGICYEGDCPGHDVFSTDGTCGPSDGIYRGCGGQWGDCCNMDGKCGFGDEFCGPGVCSMGNCAQRATSPPAASFEVPQTWTFGNSTDGSCGPENGFTCGVLTGNCCNKDGRCGSFPSDCGEGCQPLYGQCNDTAPPILGYWRPLGCYKDLHPFYHHILYQMQPTDDKLTIESCQMACLVKGHSFSGVEDGTECWCGIGIQSPSINIPTALFECRKGCPGNMTQTCGNSGRIFMSKFMSEADIYFEQRGRVTNISFWL